MAADFAGSTSDRVRPVSASRICYLSARLRGCCRQSRSAAVHDHRTPASPCHFDLFESASGQTLPSAAGNPLQTSVDGQTELQQQSALQDTAAIAGNAMAVDRWWL